MRALFRWGMSATVAWAIVAALTLMLGGTGMVVLAAPTVMVAPAATAADSGTAVTATASAPATSAATKSATSRRPDELVGWMKLSGPLLEGPPPFAFMGKSGRNSTLDTVLAQLHHVAGDKHTKGLVIYLDEPELSMTQVHTLTQALAQVRAAGKKVLVFSEAYDLHSYLLACSADEILLQHQGQIEIVGLGMEEMYLAGLLEKVGVKADLMQVGKYKGAQEPLTRTAPTPEWSQNIDSLLDDVYAQVLDTIAKARGLTPEETAAAMRDCLSMSDEDYVRRHVVDELVDRDLAPASEATFGKDFSWDEDMGQAQTMVPMDNPFAIMQMLFKENKPRITRPSLALIHATGTITSGDSQRGEGALPTRAGLFGSSSIGSRTMVRLLGDAKDDDHIKGVVIRLDSPGGSALASEVMWQAIRQLAEEKPVVIVVEGMAASGGYYIATACDQIYVSPASIVGSIGVVGGKIVMGGLYDKLGVGVVERSRGPMGGLFNSTTPFTPAQRDAIGKSMQRTYDLFVDRVKTGRGSRIQDVGSVAEGRIFTGRRAIELGMADKVGTVEDAQHDLAEQLQLKPGTYDVIDLPGPMSLPEYLDQMFGVSMRGDVGGLAAPAGTATLEQAAAAVLGPNTWMQASAVLDGMMLLQREPVLALMPVVLRMH